MRVRVLGTRFQMLTHFSIESTQHKSEDQVLEDETSSPVYPKTDKSESDLKA